MPRATASAVSDWRPSGGRRAGAAEFMAMRAQPRLSGRSARATRSGRRDGLSGATRSGKARASAAALGAITPRSVTNPVTSRAGVTSKAGFAAGRAVGHDLARSRSGRRGAARHLRDLLGGALLDGNVGHPVPSVQSMVGDGSAT